MLFGQSVFQSVLTRLKAQEDEDEPGETASAFRIPGLNAGFVAATTEAPATGTRSAADSYLAILAEAPLPAETPTPPAEPEPPSEPEPPPVPDYLLRLSEAEIAEELAISASETAGTLADKRRQFARRNHPDGVALHLRDNATIRMKTANLLIDRAIKDLYWRSS